VFTNAFRIAAAFTHPVICSMRFFDDRVECSIGSFIVVNDEGWVITAAHLIEPAAVYQQHQQKIAAYASQVKEIERGPGTPAGKAKRIRAIPANKRWLKNYSLWWGWDGREVADFRVLPEADLALGKLEPYEASLVSEYPVFGVSPAPQPGMSLCKLGFPFHDVRASFDTGTETFRLAPGTLPAPRFPLDGIMTRSLSGEAGRYGGIDVNFLETSSPGLRGQSGGPVFDVEGRVWAMQVRTHHFPLGFSPTVTQGDRKLEEHQFLNAGVGVQSETIVAFARENGVRIAAE
jgi:S1-C subfamily serine protease